MNPLLFLVLTVITGHPAVFDIVAKLQVSGGPQCPCLTVRFTNLGPDASNPFAYQVVEYRWLVQEKRYEVGKPLNSLNEGAVPSLSRSASVQRTYSLKLESGSTYLYKLEYTPALRDADDRNHTVELRYAFP